MPALTRSTAAPTGHVAATLRVLLVLALLLPMAVAGPPQARAETIVVGDGDVAALIGAIEDAIGTDGPTLITLAPAGRYVLGRVDNTTGGANGLPVITGQVVIDGNGATISRDVNAPLFRLFNVSLGGELHLRDVTLHGGRVESTSSPSNYGGAVYTRGILTLTDTHVTGNHASNSGGGIYNAGNSNSASGTVTLVDSTVTDNTAHIGGGLYNSSTGRLTLASSVVSGNVSTSSGGGIYNLGAPSGRLTVTDSILTGNSAALGGGGLRTAGFGSTVTVHGTSISDNDGGGLTNSSSGRVTVVATSLIGNRSPYAGAGASNSGGVLTLEASTVADNTAEGAGGGIHNATGWLELTNSTLAGNRTDSDGGGLSNTSGTVAAVATTIAHNHAAASGGGIATGVALTLTGSLVAANTAASGGDDLRGDLGPGSTHNLVGGEPGLDPDGLRDNGGPTHTIALTPESPAIDAVPTTDCPVEVDQRGLSRPQGDGCDIGAFESAAVTVADGDVAGLIAAIELANLTGGRIALAADGDYVLTERYTTEPRAAGLPPITGDVAIDAANAVIRRSEEPGTPTFSVVSIAAGGSLTLDRATIAGGDAGFARRGGGIWNDRGVLTLTRSTVTGNEGGISGTGLRSEPPIITVVDSEISGNDGRGIFSNHARLTVTDSTIADNAGGGIFHSESGTVRVTRTTIRGNRAVRQGGGMQVGGATANITDSLLEDNHAELGGGIYVYPGASVRLTGTTVRRNTTIVDPGTGYLAGVGAGIYNGARLTLTDSIVSANTASRSGGGIYNSTAAQADLPSTILAATTVSTNTATTGGGIYNAGGRVDITGGAITRNAATGAGGGINNQTRLSLDGTLVEGNEAASGAAVANGYLPRDPAASLTITGALLADNRATGNGGAISNSSGSLTLTDSTVRGNQASTGGGISAYSGSQAVAGTTISGNTAAQDGGGVFNASGAFALTNSTVAGNTAAGDGGGINSTNGPLTLRSSTVSGNTAAHAGGVSSPGSGWLTMEGSLVAANVAGTIPDIDADVDSDRGYNLVGDGTGSRFFAADRGNQIGTGATPLDPRLAPLADHGGPTETMALLPDSPAIDVVPVGTNGCGDTLATDQRGVVRPQGPACDVGAFEAAAGAATAPGAPTGVSATAGDGSITVVWSPPASDGGSTVTGYTLTTEPAGASTTVDGATSTAVVTGLTNGTSYLVTVTATNAAGTGPASAPSLPVTPYAPVPLTSYTTTTVEAGDEVVVSPQGQGPTVDDPVQLTITSPNAGTVVTGWQEPLDPPEAGYTFAGLEFHVRAPDGTVDAPLELTFELHLSAFDDGVDAMELVIFRDGVAVPDCTDAPAAVPDPCVAERAIDGDLALVRVLTSQASVWQAGASTTVADDDDTRAPLVRDVIVTPSPVAAGTPLTLTATADDHTMGGSAIAAAAYRWRTARGSDWSDWSELQVEAGDDPATAALSGTLTHGLPHAGRSTVCVRAADAAGNISDGQACTEVVVAAAASAAGLGTARERAGGRSPRLR